MPSSEIDLPPNVVGFVLAGRLRSSCGVKCSIQHGIISIEGSESALKMAIAVIHDASIKSKNSKRRNTLPIQNMNSNHIGSNQFVKRNFQILQKINFLQVETDRYDLIQLDGPALKHVYKIRGIVPGNVYAIEDVGEIDSTPVVMTKPNVQWIKCDDVLERCVAELEPLYSQSTYAQISLGKTFLISNQPFMNKPLSMVELYGLSRYNQFSTEIISNQFHTDVPVWCQSMGYSFKNFEENSTVFFKNLETKDKYVFKMYHDTGKLELKRQSNKIAMVSFMSPGISTLEFRLTLKQVQSNDLSNSETEMLDTILSERFCTFENRNIDWNEIDSSWCMETILFEKNEIWTNGNHTLILSTLTQAWKNRPSVGYSSIDFYTIDLTHPSTQIRELLHDGMSLVKHLS